MLEKKARTNKHASIIDDLFELGMSPAGPEIPKGDDAIFDGMTFVITGTLPTMKRNEAKALIESKGGKAAGLNTDLDKVRAKKKANALRMLAAKSNNKKSINGGSSISAADSNDKLAAPVNNDNDNSHKNNNSGNHKRNSDNRNGNDKT